MVAALVLGIWGLKLKGSRDFPFWGSGPGFNFAFFGVPDRISCVF